MRLTCSTTGMAWQLYLSEFYKPIAEASPHAGHVALARLEKEMFGDRCTVVTMNVDGLHSAAGSSQVLEVHGTVNRVLCRCVIAPPYLPPLRHQRLDPRTSHVHTTRQRARRG
jgi:NAD-dependent SIR2 family protein deacetylase